MTNNEKTPFLNPQRNLLIIGTILWCVGIIELVSHTSQEPAWFGRYSTGLLVGIGVCTAISLVWLLLVISKQTPKLIQFILDIVHRSALFSLATLATLVAAFYYLSNRERMPDFPILQLSLLLYVAVLMLVVIFAGWPSGQKKPWWQRIVVGLLAIALIGEIVLQILAATGSLPGTVLMNAGMSVPYGRVFNNAEGNVNGRTNQFGWYAPDWVLEEDNRRIVLIGDGFVEGMQVDKDATLGAQLEEMLGSAENDVIALGASGFGPAHYLELVKHAIRDYEADEIVILINLGDDFANTVSELDGVQLDESIFYVLNEQRQWALTADSWLNLHAFEHFFKDGFRPVYFNWTRTVESHWLLPKFLRDTTFNNIYNFGTSVLDRELVRNSSGDVVSTRFVPIAPDSQDLEDATAVTTGLLELATVFAEAQNVPVSFVTVPVFTDQFYIDNGQTEWDSAELFVTEAAMGTFSAENDFPFLGMSQYMQDSGVTLADLQTYYFFNGTGHLTPEGHSYFAQTIASCLFEQANCNQ